MQRGSHKVYIGTSDGLRGEHVRRLEGETGLLVVRNIIVELGFPESLFLDDEGELRVSRADFERNVAYRATNL